MQLDSTGAPIKHARIVECATSYVNREEVAAASGRWKLYLLEVGADTEALRVGARRGEGGGDTWGRGTWLRTSAELVAGCCQRSTIDRWRGRRGAQHIQPRCASKQARKHAPTRGGGAAVGPGMHSKPLLDGAQTSKTGGARPVHLPCGAKGLRASAVVRT